MVDFRGIDLIIQAIMDTAVENCCAAWTGRCLYHDGMEDGLRSMYERLTPAEPADE
jgi:hypothetical protein